MLRTSEVLGHGPSRLVSAISRLIRIVVVVCVVAASGWLIVDRVAHRSWADTEHVQPADSTYTSRSTRAALRRSGVRVEGRVATALDALIGVWSARPDLQQTFTLDRGIPDVQGLLSWVAATPDASAFDLVTYRGALDELGYRMAILPPNGDIVPVLAWTLRNRPHPVQISTDALLRVADAWRARPEIRDRYTVNGRVRVRALLFWASIVTPDDPNYVAFAPVSMQLAFLAREYKGPAA